MGIRKINFKDFKFINIANPGEQVLKELKEAYDFNALDLEDFTNKSQISKIETYKNYSLIVLDFPVFTNERSYTTKHEEEMPRRPLPVKLVRSTISNLLTLPANTLSLTFSPPAHPKKKRIFYSQVYFFIGGDYLVVLHDNELPIINEFFKMCEEDEAARQDLMKNGPVFLAYRIIDALVDACFPVANELSSTIELIDRSLEVKNSQSILEEISVTRRNLVYFQTMIKPALPIYKQLEEGKYKELNGYMKNYWSNLFDHVQNLWNRLEDSRELIEGISDSNESLIVIRSNEVVKVLTLVFTFTIPATVLGTFYGMNILLPGGLEAGSWRFLGEYTAFYVITGISVISFCIMLLYFKYKNWF